MILYSHQEKLIKEHPKKTGIFWQTGSGKTTVALLLANKIPNGTTLVVAPKTQVLDQNWQREYKRLGLTFPLTVVSKERFKRDQLCFPRFDTLILDEAHFHAGATPTTRYVRRQEIPKTSQLFDATLAFIKRTKPTQLYPLTATPIRSPMSVWALGRLLGRDWDFFDFRRRFYVKLPMPGRTVYAPKKDTTTKEYLGTLVKRIGYTWRLEEGFDVPEQLDKTVHCPVSDEQKNTIKSLPLEFPDPLVLALRIHQAEQGKSKCEAIEDLMLEFGKVLVFARYTEQIQAIEVYCKKRKIPVCTMTGQTKDRRGFMEQAEAMTEGVTIVQSQISAGYELPSFRCTIFASCSWSYVDLTQARGRTLRVNNLNRNLYVFLVSGAIDRAVLAALSQKQDFSEKIYSPNEKE